MAKGSKYYFTEQDVWKENLERDLPEGVVFIDNEDHFIHLRCLCGCGAYRKLPMKGYYPNLEHHWEIILPNTIKPSIEITDGCRSHLSLKNGIVE